MNKYWTSLASLLGALAFFQSLLLALFPPELRYAAARLYRRLSNTFSTHCYFDITETDGVNTNELYNAVQLYLTSSSSSANRVSLTRPRDSSSLVFGLAHNDTIPDTFQGVHIQWEHVVSQRQPNASLSWRPIPDEKRGFLLRARKKDRTLVLGSYLDHVMDMAADIRRKNEDRLLYTNSGSSLDASHGHPWEAVPFKHPSTFETLAMDPEKKREIMEDLKDFKSGKGFYQKAGRAWKRGYLLYGPPGTGKSSMIAAMANYLGYDIYDLELTEVKSNSDLRKLLMKTNSKSIIVIEDIDCSTDLGNRKTDANNKIMSTTTDDPYDDHRMSSRNYYEHVEKSKSMITLSGLLNFTDGLWSCCGSERVFVFTTNHVEKLDPALLRSGRMDMHIHMGYCSFPALKIMWKNYMGYQEGGGLDDHVDDGVVEEVERVIEKARITPADVSEVLIKNRREKGKAMVELLEELKRRVERNLSCAYGGERISFDS